METIRIPVRRQTVAPAAGTFAADFAATLTLANGATVFVKASMNRAHGSDYRKKASIAAHPPHGLPSPALRGWFTKGEWIVWWFDAVDGFLPANPGSQLQWKP
ncbi:hypothetical protein GCM10009596_11460 [Arthrobacter rhombi]|uniref:hypothetical protein n=1 Tax=Arthrobacter rhombi TaxID=71253 RepID=UPI0031DC1AF0